MALVFLGETFDGVVLVLVNAALKKSSDTHVKTSRSASKDVNPEFVVEAVTHGNHEDSTTGSLKRTPRISMAEENVSGSLHSASVATAPSSSVEMTKRGLRSRTKQNACCRRGLKLGSNISLEASTLRQ